MERKDGGAEPNDEGELNQRRVGRLEELLNLDAVVRERGYFLLLRYVGQKDGQDAFEAAPARMFSDPEGEIGRLRIGQDGYVVNLSDLEIAVLEGGNFRAARYEGQVNGEDMFAPLQGRIIGTDAPGLPELHIGEERYLLILEDFQDAVTDPATYDPHRDGPPYPIDVLRDPPGPE
jgi:hypothetical protein